MDFKVDEIKHWQHNPNEKHEEDGIPPLNPAVCAVAWWLLGGGEQWLIRGLHAAAVAVEDVRLHSPLDVLIDSLKEIRQLVSPGACPRGFFIFRQFSQGHSGLRGWGPQGGEFLVGLCEDAMISHRNLDGLQSIQVLFPDEVVHFLDICDLGKPGIINITKFLKTSTRPQQKPSACWGPTEEAHED